MCVVSAVGDYWRDDFTKKYPSVWPAIEQVNSPIDLSKFATKDDIERIRKELVELKELLKAAIRFDSATDQDHCENEDKIALIKKVADAVGIDLKDLDLN